MDDFDHNMSKNENELDPLHQGKSEVKICNLIMLASSQERYEREDDYDEFDDMPELMSLDDSDEEEFCDNILDSMNLDKEESEAEESDENNRKEDEDKIYYSEICKQIKDQKLCDGKFNGLVVFLLDNRYSTRYPSDDCINWEEDVLIFPSDFDAVQQFKGYTAYKQFVHPVSGTLPEGAKVH